MYYLNAKKFFDDRLTIFQKKVSKNWYGRIYIDGNSKKISRKTRNFKIAKTALFKWYHSLQHAQSHNLIIHDFQFNKLFKKYIEYRKENNHRSKRLRVSTKWIKEVSTEKDRDTRRTFFRIKDYDKLLSFSRGRIKETENEYNRRLHFSHINKLYHREKKNLISIK